MHECYIFGSCLFEIMICVCMFQMPFCLCFLFLEIGNFTLQLLNYMAKFTQVENFF